MFKSVGVPSSLANICMGIANLSGEPIEAVLFLFRFLISADGSLTDLNSVCSLPGSIVAMLLMDRVGRKVLLAGSFFGMVSILLEL